MPRIRMTGIFGFRERWNRVWSVECGVWSVQCTNIDEGTAILLDTRLACRGDY